MKQKWRVYDIRTKIYTFTVRTVDSQLAKYFSDVLKNHYTQKMKGLTVENRIIPQKMISEIFSLSPVITKSNEGYWRSHMVSASKEGVVLFPPPIDILGKTNIF